jgi:diguanylate cyclase (GGDEF)-like protein
MALKAVEYGAQDYLFKDKANGNLIKRAMHYAIQRKQFEGGLIARANFDPLTGLANRLLFESRLDMALARGKRTGDGVGILFLDLDHFKQVNDTMGHAAGDSVLQQVGARLKQSVRPYDTVARFGGDEFALLIEGIKKPNDCSEVAQNIIKRIEEPLIIAGHPAKVGASIGIAVCFGGSMTREDVLRQADEAMYSAKQSPESAYRHHTTEIRGEALARNKMT